MSLPSVNGAGANRPVFFDGPTSVRERDQYRPEFAKRAPPNADISKVERTPYTKWHENRVDLLAGWMFRPTGYFKDQRGHKAGAADTFKPPPPKQYIPGYTGFVRGSQHVSGRTYGETTRRCLDTDYREIVTSGSIPSDPHNNRKVRMTQPENTFVTNTFGGKVYHIPGYTGYVPGSRETFGRTYGACASANLIRHSQRHPRPNPQERRGYAFTALPRSFLTIDSAPLPGSIRTNKGPDKLVPAHLRHLQYLPA